MKTPPASTSGDHAINFSSPVAMFFSITRAVSLPSEERSEADFPSAVKARNARISFGPAFNHVFHGELASLRVVPLTLNERGLAPENHIQTRGRPSFARGEDAARILSRVETLSAPYGTRMIVRDGVGLIG